MEKKTSKKDYELLMRRKRQIEERIIVAGMDLLRDIIPSGKGLVINHWGHSEDMNSPLVIEDNAVSAPYPEYTRWNPYAVRNNYGEIEVSSAESQDEFERVNNSFVRLEHCQTFGSLSVESIVERVLSMKEGRGMDSMGFFLTDI